MAALIQRVVLPQATLATLTGGQAFYVGSGAPPLVVGAAVVPPKILDLSQYTSIVAFASLSAALVTATQVLINLQGIIPEIPVPVAGLPVQAAATGGVVAVFNNMATTAAITSQSTVQLITGTTRFLRAAISVQFNATPAGGGDMYLWFYGLGDAPREI